MTEDSLHTIDDALIALRHLWSTPPQLHDATLGSVDMSTLWVVDGLRRGPANAEMTVSDLARHMGVAHSTASRLVARAEEVGTVRRATSATDHRRVAVHLTATGRELALAGLDFRLSVLRSVTEDWSIEERATFADLLDRFAKKTHEHPTQPTEGNP
jgi:DNA-binding MarR family transcriptional regulator